MCRGKDEPGGPVRCSHHMGEKLLAARAKFVSTKQRAGSLRTRLEEGRAYAAQLEQLALDNPNLSQHISPQELETLEASLKKMENEARRLEAQAQTWQGKVVKAQLDYDSTRSGLLRLTDERNRVSKDLADWEKNADKHKEELAEHLPEGATQEEIEAEYEGRAAYLKRRKQTLNQRLDKASDRLDEERAWKIQRNKAVEEDEEETKPRRAADPEEDEETGVQGQPSADEDEEEYTPRRAAADEEDEEASPRPPAQEDDEETGAPRQSTEDEEEAPQYRPIDNNEDVEDQPNGDESDVLMDEELNSMINDIVDDLELTGVSVDYGEQIDPETGNRYSQKDIEVFSQKMRREARARMRRQAMADGDNKELLRALIRSAVYRALRHNKATRKVLRLVGIQHYNALIDKISERNLNRQDKKIAKSKERWKAKREMIADEEEESLESIEEKDRSKHASQMEKIDKHLKDGALTEEEHAYYKKSYDNELKRNLSKIDYEKDVIAKLRIKWAEEEAEEQRLREERDAEIKRLIAEQEKQRDEIKAYNNLASV